MSEAHAHAHDHGHGHAPNIPVEGTFDFTNGKMAMWLFLVSDAMAFIGFLGAYMVLRMTATANPIEGSLPWMPDWMLPMDLVLTGLNTFVLICSSVFMVKSLAAIQDGRIGAFRKWLAATMLGGAFFVGFQVWEWNHFFHSGITVQGLGLPTLAKAIENAKAGHKKTTKFELALQLFGERDLEKAGELEPKKTAEDFKSGNFSEAEYLALPLKLMQDGDNDTRPVRRGVIHHPAFGVPTTKDHAGEGQDAVFKHIEVDADPKDRAKVVEEYRAKHAKVPNLFSSTFFVLTGFHGFHVLIGVLYLGVVLLRSLSGVYTSKNNSSVEIVGLYWHFVDLVWVLLFMLIYLIT